MQQRFSCKISVQVHLQRYKYIYIGVDRTVFSLQEAGTVDEIEQFQNGRYISASEAVWRILGFKMHGHSHSVVRLPVHLPEGQTVLYSESANPQSVLENNRKTMLTEYFTLCSRDQEASRLTYSEIGEHYIFDKASKSWKRRTLNVKVEDSNLEFMQNAYGFSSRYREVLSTNFAYECKTS